MAMTYNQDPAKVIDALETVKKTGRGVFLPGDGFDKIDAPMLDEYLTGLGYSVCRAEKHGSGQYALVATSCGLRISRNGYCCTETA